MANNTSSTIFTTSCCRYYPHQMNLQYFNPHEGEITITYQIMVMKGNYYLQWKESSTCKYYHIYVVIWVLNSCLACVVLYLSILFLRLCFLYLSISFSYKFVYGICSFSF